MRLITIILIFGVITSCNDVQYGINNKKFHIDLFEENIRNIFDQHCVGYAYCINKNGQLSKYGASGLAVTAKDGTEQPMTINTRINIASISKFITALAAIRAIDDNDNGIDFSTPIGAYLPVSWTPSDNFKQITFRELLTHKSGILPNNKDYKQHQTFDFLKNMSTNWQPTTKSYQYCNKNFSLFRVLIPNLMNSTPWSAGLSEEKVYAEVYKYFVEENVFKKAGITNSSLKWEDGYALLYPYPYQGQSGSEKDDWTLISGAGGWYLSAVELAAIMAYTWFSDQIVNDEERKLLSGNSIFGLSESTTGEYGQYQAKLGGLPPVNNYCIMINFPNKIQAVVLTTGYDGWSKMRYRMVNAYESSWE